MPNYTVIQGNGEWSALYDKGGVLIAHGDHYIVEDKLRKEFGVETIHSDDFVRSEDYDDKGRTRSRDIVAKTIEQFEIWQNERQTELDRAKQLREEADAIEKRFR